MSQPALSDRYLSTTCGAHRGLGQALVTRARVPFLHVALRDRVRATQSSKRVDHGRPPGCIWRVY